MTDFVEKVRHQCRNPRCRSKLPAPVTNPRKAFCTRGCYASFYRKRCLICECEMERKTERQLICGKRRCRDALQARIGLGRYLPTSACVSPLENPIKMGIKSGVANDRPWRIAAGPGLSPSALHCATVGAGEVVDAINRTDARHWREHNAKVEERCLIKRHDPPINIVGGFKFSKAPVIGLAPMPRSSRPPALSHDGSLDIPDFLCRTPVNPPPRLAA